jgi:hypothetical protein
VTVVAVAVNDHDHVNDHDNGTNGTPESGSPI